MTVTVTVEELKSFESELRAYYGGQLAADVIALHRRDDVFGMRQTKAEVDSAMDAWAKEHKKLLPEV